VGPRVCLEAVEFKTVSVMVGMWGAMYRGGGGSMKSTYVSQTLECTNHPTM
jgi:hypothetical protein